MGQMMQGMDKSPARLATDTAKKILLSVNDDKFRSYVMRALAILDMGAAMSEQQGPQSTAGAPPQKEGPQGPGPSSMPVPSMSPGQMPG